jgi:predicted RNA-binding protein associated with RNAse of E/G family
LISLDQRGLPIDGYVNINLCPRRVTDGWCWKDLKLDIKLVINYSGEWSPILLDVTEFDSASLDFDDRQLALNEVDGILRQIASGEFPFSTRIDPWFGFKPLSRSMFSGPLATASRWLRFRERDEI